MAMARTVSDPPALGRLVRETRRALGLTQPKLALSAGVGVRFLVDIEKGKPTAQIGKIMQRARCARHRDAAIAAEHNRRRPMPDRSLDVWLLGELVGRLDQTSGRLTFTYDAGWLGRHHAVPLSASLPLQEKPFDDRAARPFFAGLLPGAG